MPRSVLACLNSLEVIVKTKLAVIVALFAFALTAVPAEAKSQKKKTTAYQKPVKMLIGAIRYKKDDMALKLLALDQMTVELNKNHLDKVSAAQKKAFAKNLGVLLKKLSFPKARDLFKHLDAILYDEPVVKGDRASIKSTIVVHRAYKKTELVITWSLLKKGKNWLILDTTTVGESTSAGIREDQVDPLFKEGGIKLVLQKMEEKIKELK